MDLETTKKLIASPAVQKYLSAIDSDAEDALGELKGNLGALGLYSDRMISEYKADGADLDKAWGNFNLEVNRVTFGKAKDGRAAMTAYSRYVLTLEILEQQNVRFTAYIDAGAAEAVAWMLKVLIAYTRRLREEFKALLAQLKALEAALKRAKKDVTGAELQRILDVGITAVGLCIAPAGLGMGIGVAVGIFTVQMVLDSALGPTGPGVLSTLNTAAGDTVGLPKKVGPKLGKLGGALSGLITLKMDSDEVDEARRIVAEVQKQAREAQKRLETIERFLSRDIADVQKAERTMQAALAVAQKNAKLFRSQSQKRNGLLKELAKIR